MSAAGPPEARTPPLGAAQQLQTKARRHHDAARPQSSDAAAAAPAFMTSVGRTWFAGLAFFVGGTGAGWLSARLNPGGATIADLFR